ncbi:MAG: DUF58 domain-containing protein [Longimicrobiales bacterium]|nr:DUF58 domain-containing protein [Longimicrobiales bacterium]
MDRTATASARFLDPTVLARIGNLDLLARTVVDGFLNGSHKAPYLGQSMDFAQHRPYVPGDDIRRLDWRLYARTDRFYVKQFEAETNTDVVAMVDVSDSMAWTSDAARPTKLDYARFLAASLLHLSRRQRDRVGCVTFDDAPIEHVPATARNLDLSLMALERSRARGPGNLERAVHHTIPTLYKRGIVLVISDFYEDVDDVVRAVRHLTGRRQDVILFHLLDPGERTLPPGDAVSFEDAETGEQVPVIPDRLREGYEAVIDEHVAALRYALVREGVDFVPVDTSTPLDHALFAYLTLRAHTTRRR